MPWFADEVIHINLKTVHRYVLGGKIVWHKSLSGKSRTRLLTRNLIGQPTGSKLFFFTSLFSLDSRSTFCCELITGVICVVDNDWFMKTTSIYFCRRWYFCLISTTTLVDLSILAGEIRMTTDQWVWRSVIVDTMLRNFVH